MGKASESIYLPPNRVTCVPEYESLLVATIYDPASNPVSVFINGVTYSTSDASLTLTARGTNIVWTGKIDLSAAGLSNNVRYPWTVDQGVNYDAGSYYHTPARYTNHRLHFVSCDNNEVFTSEVSGHWEQMWHQYEAGIEISGVCVTDDDGYVDGIIVRDDGLTYAFPNQSGLASSGQPQNTGLLDDYLKSWCATIGMLGPEQTEYTAAELGTGTTNRSLRQVLWGREYHRAKCRKNINRISNARSDHDSRDDEGWDIEPASDVHFANGSAAFDAFHGLCRPDIGNLITKTDLSAAHTVFPFGDICLGSLDYITNAARTWGSNVAYGNSTQITQFTQLLGDAQIDDYLNAVDAADLPITILTTQFSMRYLINRTGAVPPNAFTDSVTERSSGAQHPLYDHCLANFARLFTEEGNTASSIMDNPKTNGTKGSFLMVGGDLHLAQALDCHHPAYVSAANGKTNLAENFMHINIATVNGSSLTGSVGVTGDSIADCTLAFAEESGIFSGAWYGFYIDVKGFEAPPRIEAVLSNKDNRVLLHKQFMPVRGGNTGHDMTVKLQNKSIGFGVPSDGRAPISAPAPAPAAGATPLHVVTANASSDPAVWNPFNFGTIETLETDASYSGGTDYFMRSTLRASQAAELNCGLWFECANVLGTNVKALMANPRSYSVGWTCRISSAFYDGVGNQQKVMIIEHAEDGANPTTRPMFNMWETDPAQLKRMVALHNDAAGEWMTETGTLGVPPTDTDTLVFDMHNHYDEWLYFEMTTDHVADTVTLHVFTRDGLISEQNFLVNTSVASATDEIFSINFFALFDVATPADSSAMYGDTIQFQIGDSFMGPPAGFVI